MDQPKSYLMKFEVLSETKDGNLVNGFSAVISMNENSVAAMGGIMPNIGCTTNNCNGGNCVSGCGGGSDRIIMCTLP